MTKQERRWLVTLLIVSALGWIGYRYFWSCKWAVRDITLLSLRGSTHVESCRNDFWGSQNIDVVLDSAATNTAAKEAAVLYGWRRMEDIDPTTNSTDLRRMIGHHGYFRTNYDNFPIPGPPSMMFLDINERKLSLRTSDQ